MNEFGIDFIGFSEQCVTGCRASYMKTKSEDCPSDCFTLHFFARRHYACGRVIGCNASPPLTESRDRCVVSIVDRDCLPRDLHVAVLN